MASSEQVPLQRVGHKMSTYALGFYFKKKSGKALTRDGVVKLCRMLADRFGEGNCFEPEAIGGGFILWGQWPGKTDSEYKCMRASGALGSRKYWPYVKPDAITSWVGDHTVVIDNGTFSTCLKAFDGAPAWTLSELQIVKECLEECSDHKVFRMPKASKLKWVEPLMQ
jgi:hypothetical protein